MDGQGHPARPLKSAGGLVVYPVGFRREQPDDGSGQWRRLEQQIAGDQQQRDQTGRPVKGLGTAREKQQQGGDGDGDLHEGIGPGFHRAESQGRKNQYRQQAVI